MTFQSTGEPYNYLAILMDLNNDKILDLCDIECLARHFEETGRIELLCIDHSKARLVSKVLMGCYRQMPRSRGVINELKKFVKSR